MSIIDGRAFMHEGLEASAVSVLNAYHKAPQMTGRVKLQSMVLTGEDIMPMMNLMEDLEKKLGAEHAKSIFLPIYLDYMAYKNAIEKGMAPVILVLGADLTKSELQWDCGACGFATCKEFNKYSKESGGMGLFGAGPSCAWKCIDYCAAADYACAAAHQLNIENRIQATFGSLAFMLGYLEDCSMVLVLPLGPNKDMYYYSRAPEINILPQDNWEQFMVNNYTMMFKMFNTNLNPAIKGPGDWWTTEPTKRDRITRIGPDEPFEQRVLEAQEALLESAMEIRSQVHEIKVQKGLASPED